MGARDRGFRGHGACTGDDPGLGTRAWSVDSGARAEGLLVPVEGERLYGFRVALGVDGERVDYQQQDSAHLAGWAYSVRSAPVYEPAGTGVHGFSRVDPAGQSV